MIRLWHRGRDAPNYNNCETETWLHLAVSEGDSVVEFVFEAGCRQEEGAWQRRPYRYRGIDWQ